MVLFATRATIFQIALERKARARKGDVRPRNLVLADELHLETLGPRPELGLVQCRAEEHMDLMRAEHRDQAQERTDLDLRHRFLMAFAGRALLQRLAHFHEPGRDRPVAETRLDRALA